MPPPCGMGFGIQFVNAATIKTGTPISKAEGADDPKKKQGQATPTMCTLRSDA